MVCRFCQTRHAKQTGRDAKTPGRPSSNDDKKNIPVAPQPKPYQVEGIDFLSARSAALLGDDAGLGKSMQMIGAANQVGAARILVICPAIGRVSWALQFAEWDSARRPVYQYPDGTAGLIPDGPLALIVTMDWLAGKARGKNALTMLANAQPFDVAFVDEAHFLKTPAANRTRTVYGKRLDRADGVLANVPRVWTASATYTPLHAGEIYTHLRAVLPDVLRGLFKGAVPTHHEFLERFCLLDYTPFGVRVAGNNTKTIPALRDALAPHLILRRKADVLADLAPIQTALLPLEVADKATIDSALETACSGGTDDEFLAALAVAWADPQHSTRRRVLGVLKADAIAPWINDFLSSDRTRKLVVFAHHRSVIEALADRFAAINPCVIHGGTSATQDRAAVGAFQTDLARRLFIGQTRAAGTSITLTAADTALILEPDPSPANNYQAISRLHRLGQKGTVLAYFATVASNSAERRLADILRRRALDNEQLFGTNTPGVVPGHSQ